jgi:hypothetical protein
VLFVTPVAAPTSSTRPVVPTFGTSVTAPPINPQGPAPTSAAPVSSASAAITTNSTLSSLARQSQPPMFGGPTEKTTLENWLMSLQVWMSLSRVTDDKSHILMTMTCLKGDAQRSMIKYYQQSVARIPLGTWAEFESNLTALYCTILPAQQAREKLDALCTGKAKDMPKFQLEFYALAIQSELGNIDPISKIEKVLPGCLLNHFALLCGLTPLAVPWTWPEYLKKATELDAETWTYHTPAQTTSTSKPAAANAISESKTRTPMNNKQIGWVKERKCSLCGKHPWKHGKKCPNPKYTDGPYQLPCLEHKREPRKKKELVKVAKADNEDDGEPDENEGEEVKVATAFTAEEVAMIMAARNKLAMDTTSATVLGFPPGL